MAKCFFVYEHWRPDEGVCFYVGKGKDDRAHDMKKRSRHHKNIRNKLIKLGMCVEVFLYSSGLTESEAFELEKIRIAHYRARGVKLVNKTDGGEGVSGYRHTEENRAHFSKIFTGRPKNRGTTGLKFSEETREKMSIAAKGKPKSLEHALKVGAKHKGKNISAETRAKISKAKKGKKCSEEYKIRHAIRMKDWWANRKGVAV